MAAAPRGLSAADLTLIRETLAAGRKPKVVFTESAGQVVGKVGQVVELTDPKASDDWIVVRFGRDELPFSPADLAVPAKAPAKRAESPPQPPPAPPLRLTEPPTPVKAKPATVASFREEPRMSAANTSASTGAAASAGPAESNGTPRPAKAAKPRPVASLTVTLAYTDREWTVAAQQGAKTLAKPYVIKPTEALQMVALIDVPGVHEAVEAIIDAERAEAEGRAMRLREELAEIESRLAELTSKGMPTVASSSPRSTRLS
jgi:hypothetical protein